MSTVREHRFLDNIAIADTAFEARGTTLKELFLAATDALMATMATPSSIQPRRECAIQLQASDLSELLFALLSEVVFLKDAEAMVFCDVDISIQEGPPWELSGHVRGDGVRTDPTAWE